MNSQPDQELEQRLQQLEAEINSPTSPPVVAQPQQPVSPTDQPSVVPIVLYRFVNWFKGLSNVGKLIVVAVAFFVGLAILRIVLRLVAAAISLAILAVLLYFAYRFLSARTSDKS
ncbi:hypothetical protein [Gloeocapsopsis dulcis]|uniref:Uncharacterized protein n=1 Tax=Gloeocapsopsis dulcis AAB1 = 1H9 TaxID=1433147 RepID=A0A6N8FXG6_9CHRO|nr:hypothetical protein [Gloeocapsopsis dulcis]MUL37651.1 hypothetical protein [Gloeocapsopsis dulcis AAB1 = 1H9]WNN89215.1 hypothetical protein P0S91_23740 [Gloeocapsopsis dulcis]